MKTTTVCILFHSAPQPAVLGPSKHTQAWRRNSGFVISALKLLPSRGVAHKHAAFSWEVRGHCMLNPARFGLDRSTVEEGAGWAGAPSLGLASSDWQMLLSIEMVVFHLLGLMAHTVTDKGQQASCLWCTQKWMQTNAKQNQKALPPRPPYFALLMKLSLLVIEWFLHIFPLLLLCSHRYWFEMCCIWNMNLIHELFKHCFISKSACMKLSCRCLTNG